MLNGPQFGRLADISFEACVLRQTDLTFAQLLSNVCVHLGEMNDTQWKLATIKHLRIDSVEVGNQLDLRACKFERHRIPCLELRNQKACKVLGVAVLELSAFQMAPADFADLLPVLRKCKDMSLSGFNLCGLNLSEVLMDSVDLSNVSIDATTNFPAVLARCNLAGLTFRKGNFPPLIGRCYDVTGADLRNTNFVDCNFGRWPTLESTLRDGAKFCAEHDKLGYFERGMWYCIIGCNLAK